MAPDLPPSVKAFSGALPLQWGESWGSYFCRLARKNGYCKIKCKKAECSGWDVIQKPTWFGFDKESASHKCASSSLKGYVIMMHTLRRHCKYFHK